MAGYPSQVTDDETIGSERLDLPLLSLPELDALGAGDVAGLAARLGVEVPADWVDGVRRLAAFRARQIREHPDDAPWLLRAIVLRGEGAAGGRVIGYLNFHSAPDAVGMAEIGYTLMPDARGHGYAIEAVRAAFDWATRVHGVRRFRASVAPDNERSLHLIAKLGFRRAGEQWDPEDGLEHVFELEVEDR